MKTLLAIIVFSLHLNLMAQSETVVGTYSFEIRNSNAIIVDTLVLNEDGTFTFHEYDKHDGGIPPERNKYGKGKWNFENNIVYFSANESDLDEKHTLNFHASQARFITKSPRDKSNRNIPTSLKFFESDIFWMVKRDFLKK